MSVTTQLTLQRVAKTKKVKQREQAFKLFLLKRK